MLNNRHSKSIKGDPILIWSDNTCLVHKSVNGLVSWKLYFWTNRGACIAPTATTFNGETLNPAMGGSPWGAALCEGDFRGDAYDGGADNATFVRGAINSILSSEGISRADAANPANKTPRALLQDAWNMLLCQRFNEVYTATTKRLARGLKVDTFAKEITFLYQAETAIGSASREVGASDELRRNAEDIDVKLNRADFRKYLPAAGATGSLLPETDDSSTIAKHRTFSRTQQQLDTGVTQDGITSGPEWRFLTTIFAKPTPTGGAPVETVSSLAQMAIAARNSSAAMKEQHEMDFVRALKMTLTGESSIEYTFDKPRKRFTSVKVAAAAYANMAEACNKFDLPICSSNKKDRCSYIDLLSIIGCLSDTAKYFSEQEMTLLRTKLRLMAVRSEHGCHTDFDAYRKVFGSGANIGTLDGTILRIIRNTTIQVEGCTEIHSATAPKDAVRRTRSGVAFLELDTTSHRETIDTIGNRLNCIIVGSNALQAAGGRLAYREFDASKADDWKMRWVAELLASGMINLTGLKNETGPNPGFLVDRRFTNVDNVIARLAITAVDVVPAATLNIASEDIQSWQSTLCTELALSPLPYDSFYLSSYVESQEVSGTVLPASFHTQPRSMGTVSFIHDVAKNIGCFRQNANGSPSQLFVSTLREVQRVIVNTQNGEVNNRIAQEWASNQEAMTIACKYMWNIALREFGAEHYDVDWDRRLLMAHKNPPRKTAAGIDVEALTNVAEFLNAVEQPCYDSIDQDFKAFMPGPNTLRKADGMSWVSLRRDSFAKKTTICEREEFVHALLLTNTNFNGPDATGGPFHISPFGVNSSLRTDSAVMQEGRATALSFNQRLALHRMHIQIFFAKKNSIIMQAAIGDSCSADVVVGDTADRHLVRGYGICSMDHRYIRCVANYWMIDIEQVLFSLFYLRSQDPQRLSPSMSLFIASLPEKICQVADACCPCCIDRIVAGTEAALSLKLLRPNDYPGYPPLLNLESGYSSHAKLAAAYSSYPQMHFYAPRIGGTSYFPEWGICSDKRKDKETFDGLGGCVAMGLLLKNNYPFTAGFGVVDGGEAAYYERFGRDQVELSSIGPMVRFHNARYAKSGVYVDVYRTVEPWHVQMELANDDDIKPGLTSIFGGAKKTRLLRGAKDLVDVGINNSMVPAALTDGSYDMWMPIADDGRPYDAAYGRAHSLRRVFFAKRDAGGGGDPTVDFVLECQSNSNGDTIIRDLRDTARPNRAIVVAANTEDPAVSYFDGFAGRAANGKPRIVLSASMESGSNRLAIMRVDVGNLKYDATSELRFEVGRVRDTSAIAGQRDALILAGHPNLEVVPREISRPNVLSGISENRNPLFSFEKAIVLKDVGSPNRYELLLRAGDLFKDGNSAIDVDEIINISHTSRDLSTIPDTYWCDGPAGWLALAILALRATGGLADNDKLATAAAFIGRARTRFGERPNALAMALYGELFTEIGKIPNTDAGKPRLQTIMEFQMYCDSCGEKLATMPIAEIEKVVGRLRSYVDVEQKQYADKTSHYEVDWRLQLPVGSALKYYSVLRDKLSSRKKNKASPQEVIRRIDTCLTSLEDANRGIDAIRGARDATTHEANQGVQKVFADSAASLGVKLKNLRAIQRDLLFNAGAPATRKPLTTTQDDATRLLVDKRSDLARAKKALDDALRYNIPVASTLRKPTAEDALPLMLLVGQQKLDANKYNIARYMSRLCSLNYALMKNPPKAAEIFALTIDYALALCAYNFVAATASGNPPPVEAVSRDAVWHQSRSTIHIVALAWEATGGIVLRDDQLFQMTQAISHVTGDTTREALGGPEGRIVPTVMGGGKTKIMTPGGAAFANARGELAIVVVPLSTLQSVWKDLCDSFASMGDVIYLGALAGADSDPNWLSSFTKDEHILRSIYDAVTNAQQDGGAILLLDDAMMNRIVMEITTLAEQLSDSTNTSGGLAGSRKRLSYLSAILATFREHGRLFVDEAHKVFDPMSSLITADSGGASDVPPFIFDFVQHTYEALASDSAKAEVDFDVYADGPMIDGKFAEPPRGAAKAKWSISGADLADVRKTVRLTDNMQSAMTREVYDEKVGRQIGKFMLAQIFSRNVFSAGSNVGVQYVRGDGDAPDDFTKATIRIVFSEDPNVKINHLEICVDDLLNYICSDNFQEYPADDPGRPDPSNDSWVSDLQSVLRNPTTTYRGWAIDTAFRQVAADGGKMSQLTNEIALLRGMVSVELPRCLAKTAGVSYGEGPDGAALRVYKEGLPTRSEFAFLGTSIPLLYQLALNVGVPFGVWMKYVDNSRRAALTEQQRDDEVKSIDDSPSGRLFAAAIAVVGAGAGGAITLSEACGKPEETYKKACALFKKYPFLSIKLVRNFIAACIKSPGRSRETRPTAMLPHFHEVTAFTGTPGLPWKWVPTFDEMFPDVPTHEEKLRSVMVGDPVTDSEGINIGERLTDIVIADDNYTIDQIFKSVVKASNNSSSQLRAITDIGGHLHQIAASLARQKGKSDPDPGFELAIAARTAMANLGRAGLNVIFEGKDLRRYMLKDGSITPQPFAGSGQVIHDKFGTSPSNTLVICTQVMCTGFDIPMGTGVNVVVPHLGDTTTSSANQAAMRARKIFESNGQQIGIVLLPDFIGKMIGNQDAPIAEQKRGSLTLAAARSMSKTELGKHVVATLACNEREITKKQAAMATSAELNKIIANLVTLAVVDTFSDAQSLVSSDESSLAALNGIKGYLSALSPFLSDTHDYEPASIYFGSKQQISQSVKAFELAASIYKRAWRALLEEGVDDGQTLKFKEGFLKRAQAIISMCAKAEGLKCVRKGTHVTAEKSDIAMAIENFKHGEYEFVTDGNANERSIGIIETNKTGSADSGDIEVEVEVEVETEQEQEQEQEQENEYNDLCAILPGNPIDLCQYWSAGQTNGLSARDLWQVQQAPIGGGNQQRNRNKLFRNANVGQNAGRATLHTSMPMRRLIEMSADAIQWAENKPLASAERYMEYRGIFGQDAIRASLNFAVSHENIIPIVHSCHSEMRYAACYWDDETTRWTTVLLREDESKCIRDGHMGAGQIKNFVIVDCSTGKSVAAAADNKEFDRALANYRAEFDKAMLHVRLLHAILHGDARTVAKLGTQYGEIVEWCGGDVGLAVRFLKICIFAISKSAIDYSTNAKRQGAMLDIAQNDRVINTGFQVTREMLDMVGPGLREQITATRFGENSSSGLATLVGLDLSKKSKDGTQIFSNSTTAAILLAAAASGHLDDAKAALVRRSGEGVPYAKNAMEAIARSQKTSNPQNAQLYRAALTRIHLSPSDETRFFSEKTDDSDSTHRVEKIRLFNDYSPDAFDTLNFSIEAKAQIFSDPAYVEELAVDQIRKAQSSSQIFAAMLRCGSSELLARMSDKQLLSTPAQRAIFPQGSPTDNSKAEEIVAVLLDASAADGETTGNREATLANLLRYDQGTNRRWTAAVKRVLTPDRLKQIGNTDLLINLFVKKEFMDLFAEAHDARRKLTNIYLSELSVDDVDRMDDEVVKKFGAEIRHLLTPGKVLKLIQQGAGTHADLLDKGRFDYYDQTVDLACADLTYPGESTASDDFCRLLQILIGDESFNVDLLTDKQLELLFHHALNAQHNISGFKPMTLPSKGRRVTATFNTPKGTPLLDYLAESLTVSRIEAITSKDAYATVAVLLFKGRFVDGDDNSRAICNLAPQLGILGAKVVESCHSGINDGIMSFSWIREVIGNQAHTDNVDAIAEWFGDQFGALNLASIICGFSDAKLNSSTGCGHAAFAVRLLAPTKQLTFNFDDGADYSATQSLYEVAFANFRRTFSYDASNPDIGGVTANARLLEDALTSVMTRDIATSKGDRIMEQDATGARPILARAKNFGNWLMSYDRPMAHTDLNDAQTGIKTAWDDSVKYPWLAMIRESIIGDIRSKTDGKVSPFVALGAIIYTGSKGVLESITDREISAIIDTIKDYNDGGDKEHLDSTLTAIHTIDPALIGSLKKDAPVLKLLVRYGTGKQVASIDPAAIFEMPHSVWKEREDASRAIETLAGDDGEALKALAGAISTLATIEFIKGRISTLESEGRGASKNCSALRQCLAAIVHSASGGSTAREVRIFLTHAIADSPDDKDRLRNAIERDDFYAMDLDCRVAALRALAIVHPADNEEERRLAINGIVTDLYNTLARADPSKKDKLDFTVSAILSEKSNATKLFGDDAIEVKAIPIIDSLREECEAAINAIPDKNKNIARITYALSSTIAKKIAELATAAGKQAETESCAFMLGCANLIAKAISQGALDGEQFNRTWNRYAEFAVTRDNESVFFQIPEMRRCIQSTGMHSTSDIARVLSQLAIADGSSSSADESKQLAAAAKSLETFASATESGKAREKFDKAIHQIAKTDSPEPTIDFGAEAMKGSRDAVLFEEGGFKIDVKQWRSLCSKAKKRIYCEFLNEDAPSDNDVAADLLNRYMDGSISLITIISVAIAENKSAHDQFATQMSAYIKTDGNSIHGESEADEASRRIFGYVVPHMTARRLCLGAAARLITNASAALASAVTEADASANFAAELLTSIDYEQIDNPLYQGVKVDENGQTMPLPTIMFSSGMLPGIVAALKRISEANRAPDGGSDQGGIDTYFRILARSLECGAPISIFPAKDAVDAFRKGICYLVSIDLLTAKYFSAKNAAVGKIAEGLVAEVKRKSSELIALDGAGTTTGDTQAVALSEEIYVAKQALLQLASAAGEEDATNVLDQVKVLEVANTHMLQGEYGELYIAVAMKNPAKIANGYPPLRVIEDISLKREEIKRKWGALILSNLTAENLSELDIAKWCTKSECFIGDSLANLLTSSQPKEVTALLSKLGMTTCTNECISAAFLGAFARLSNIAKPTAQETNALAELKTVIDTRFEDATQSDSDNKGFGSNELGLAAIGNLTPATVASLPVSTIAYIGAHLRAGQLSHVSDSALAECARTNKAGFQSFNVDAVTALESGYSTAAGRATAILTSGSLKQLTSIENTNPVAGAVKFSIDDATKSETLMQRYGSLSTGEAATSVVDNTIVFDALLQTGNPDIQRKILRLHALEKLFPATASIQTQSPESLCAVSATLVNEYATLIEKKKNELERGKATGGRRARLPASSSSDTTTLQAEIALYTRALTAITLRILSGGNPANIAGLGEKALSIAFSAAWASKDPTGDDSANNITAAIKDNPHMRKITTEALADIMKSKVSRFIPPDVTVTNAGGTSSFDQQKLAAYVTHGTIQQLNSLGTIIDATSTHGSTHSCLHGALISKDLTSLPAAEKLKDKTMVRHVMAAFNSSTTANATQLQSWLAHTDETVIWNVVIDNVSDQNLPGGAKYIVQDDGIFSQFPTQMLCKDAIDILTTLRSAVSPAAAQLNEQQIMALAMLLDLEASYCANDEKRLKAMRDIYGGLAGHVKDLPKYITASAILALTEEGVKMTVAAAALQANVAAEDDDLDF
jgi:hypothetical protein